MHHICVPMYLQGHTKHITIYAYVYILLIVYNFWVVRKIKVPQEDPMYTTISMLLRACQTT